MMCPNCDGRGKTTEYDGLRKFWCDYKCEVCNGSGEIKEQTNEEWLRSCSADELAGAIYEWYSLGFTRGKNGKKLNSVTEVVEWLKQPHTLKE